MKHLVALFLIAFSVPSAAAEESKATLVLPRFRIDTSRFEKNPGLEDALKSVPSVKAQDGMFPLTFGRRHVGGFTTAVTFDSAKADLGDIAKAVDKVPASKDLQKAPAAVLAIFTGKSEKLTDEQLERIWKALEGVKGIKVAESRELVYASMFGIVLDEKGGAKLREIVDALKKAGIEMPRR